MNIFGINDLFIHSSPKILGTERGTSVRFQALSGSFQDKQLLIDVSCVKVHARWITSYETGAQTVSIYEIRCLGLQSSITLGKCFIHCLLWNLVS